MKSVFFEEGFEWVENLLQPITTQIWVVIHHWYGISALIPQITFCGWENRWWHCKMLAVSQAGTLII